MGEKEQELRKKLRFLEKKKDLIREDWVEF